MTWFNRLEWPGPTACLEMLVLAVLFYYVILFFRGTRGAQVLYGFAVVLVTLIVLTRFLHADVINWILQYFSAFLVVAFLIIFQPEIRRALAELGKQHVFLPQSAKESIVDQIVRAVYHMAQRKTGALIALEMEIGTRAIQETGTRIDSVVSAPLLSSIFYPHSPLHDGGVVLRDDRILAAGCVFPLSQREDLTRVAGTRHRAGVGLSEDTDAIVVVVSEETGQVSVAHKGRLHRALDEARLRRLLSAALFKGTRASSRLSRVKDQLDLTPKGVAKTESLKSEEAETHAG